MKRNEMKNYLTITLLVLSACAGYGEDPQDRGAPPLKGNRFLTFNTVVRVHQIEVARTRNVGRDERHLHTPEKAIRFSDITVQTSDGPQTIRRPIVIEEECIGCGICEHVCPLDGPAAVKVISRNAAKQLEETGGNIDEAVQQGVEALV